VSIALELVEFIFVNLHIEFNVWRYLRYFLYKLRANDCEERSVFWKDDTQNREAFYIFNCQN